MNVVVLLWWLPLAGMPGSSSLEQGSLALAEFKVEEAIGLLEKARGEGPYRHDQYVQLFEKLGISYAYLDRKKEALEAFDMLLCIQPGHALSYTLSPKVTFLFEEARKLSAARQPPTVDLSWPRNLKVTDPVPVDVEVVSDPKGLMKTAVLHTRLKGALEYADQTVTLSGIQRYHRIDLAPVAVSSDGPETLQLYLTVTDGRGNQVHLLGDPDHPREVSLAFEEPEPWYRKWWLWTAVGAVLAAGTGTAVYFLLREPPATVGGTFHVP